MRLYPRDDQDAVVHEGVTYRAGRDGGFDFPDDLSDRLHAFHHRKRPLWETSEERDIRLHGEEMARRRDPETLYSAVSEIASAARQMSGARPASTPDPGAAAEIAALRARVAELEAQAPAAGGDGDPESGPEPAPSPAKTARTRKPASA